MKTSRLLGLGLFVAGAALIAAGLIGRTPAATAPVDLEPAARLARARVEQALGSQAHALEPKAAEAARIAELVAAMNMGADRDTFQDLLESEDWWGPFRAHFPLTGVVTARGTLALLAPGAGDISAADATRAAGGHDLSSGVLPGHGRAYLVATARVTRAKPDGEAPIVILGTVIDHAALAKVSELTGDTVGLADDAKLIEAAGTGEPGRVLATLIGRKDAAASLLEDGRVGAAWPIGGGLRFLAAFTPPHAPAPPPSYGWIALVAAGAAAGLAGIAMAAARRTPAPAPAAVGTSDHSARVASSFESAGAPIPRSGPASEPPSAAPSPPPSALPSGFGGEARPMMTMALHSGAAAPAAAEAAVAVTGATQMGRYRLIERIGEGGMAEIFFAAAYGAEDFVRHFVVKRMHPHVARNRTAVNQFIDEAQLQARLVHSNIVPVFDFGKAGDEYFLALEYIPGRDVGQLVQRHMEHFGRALDVPTTFYILHEALEALTFAHTQTERDGRPMEVVHRDVAPGNILVSYRGEVKLTDFGIAKSDKRVSRTEVGMVKGNAGFMSPEQARGEIVDQRSDIFSAGAVLHYCLTGQLLYRGETTLNRLLRAAVGPATSQFGQIDQLPRPAAQVLRHALALDPEKRYQTAADFGRDVSAHMSDRVETARLMDVLFPASQRRDLR